MNQKRKAELQRKLSMISVPKPPSGLLERIKTDIPHDLKSADRERERFSRSTGFTLRVAASIILLVSSVYVTVRLMSPAEKSLMAPPAMAHKAVAPPAEVTVELDEAPKSVPTAAPAAAPAAASPAPQRVARQAAVSEPKKAKDAEQPKQEEVARNEVTTGGAAADAVGTVAETQALPPAAAAAPAPAVAMNNAAEEGRHATREMAKLSSRMAVRADEPTAAAPHAVFGLSVDPAAFDRVRELIEHGQRPEPGSVDVAAVVNYLAGTARPQSEVMLEVEGSRAPIDLPTLLIRFTVDTAHTELAPAPVATDASLKIILNRDAVISHRLIGAEELKTQSTLFKNTSVTGVVDVEVKPAVPPSTTIATLRLSYRSSSDGKMHTIERVVRAVQMTRKWESASLRHRLTTLGAIWSESVNGGAATDDVAQRAQRLATEAPEDARARALATAASAFFRLQSSGPTGSGR